MPASVKDVSNATGTSGGSTTIVASVPALAQPGDLLIALWGQRNTSAANPTLPGGWSNFTSVRRGTSSWLAAAYRTMVAGDTNWSFTGNVIPGGSTVSILAIRDQAASPIGVSTSDNVTSSVTDQVAPMVNVATADALVLHCVFSAVNSLTPHSWTWANDTEYADVWSLDSASGGGLAIGGQIVLSPKNLAAQTATMTVAGTYASPSLVIKSMSNPPGNMIRAINVGSGMSRSEVAN